jgi:hypothetical protein
MKLSNGVNVSICVTSQNQILEINQTIVSLQLTNTVAYDQDRNKLARKNYNPLLNTGQAHENQLRFQRQAAQKANDGGHHIGNSYISCSGASRHDIPTVIAECI